MCGEKEKGCQNPKELTDEPAKCSPEQIKKCHGDAKEHPCVQKDCEKKETDN